MLELSWSAEISRDPLYLADAIELLVAFDSEEFQGRFTRAHFIQWMTMEEIDQATQQYVHGDDLDDQHDCFDQALAVMRSRTEWLGSTYPYVIEGDEIRLTNDLSEEVTVAYLFLLVCANSRFTPSLSKHLPSQFERLCKEAYSVLFPDWANVLLFSKDSDDRKNMFGSQERVAVPKLATMLNTVEKEAEVLGHTQREYGIDLLAIWGFGDLAPYPVFAFAQCTIQESWWEKRHQARADSELTGVIDLNVGHTNFLMIPHFPRYSLGEWSVGAARSGNCILCDRLRICNLLKRSTVFNDGQIPDTLRNVFQKLRSEISIALQ